MDRVTTHLDVDDVLEIYEALIGPANESLRSRSLLESAVYAPQQSAFGEDAYPSVGKKAWAYLRGLAQNHAFIDGNKRIAWATTRAFLLVNGVGIEASTAVVEDLVVRLSDNKATEHEVLEFFQRYGRPVDDLLHDDRTA